MHLQYVTIYQLYLIMILEILAKLLHVVRDGAQCLLPNREYAHIDASCNVNSAQLRPPVHHLGAAVGLIPLHFKSKIICLGHAEQHYSHIHAI